MYQIRRENGRVKIYDWCEKLIYDVPDTAKVVYPGQGAVTSPRVSQVKDLGDDALLLALVHALKIPIE